MRKTVLMPVEKVLCDAHIARDGSEEEATTALCLGEYTWDLCLEHDVVFGRYLTGALGVPEALTGARVEPEPVAEPAPVAEPEEEAETEPEPAPLPSVMIAGEVPGYEWETAREAVRNAGYQVVGRADDSTVLLILGRAANATERNCVTLPNVASSAWTCESPDGSSPLCVPVSSSAVTHFRSLPRWARK